VNVLCLCRLWIQYNMFAKIGWKSKRKVSMHLIRAGLLRIAVQSSKYGSQRTRVTTRECRICLPHRTPKHQLRYMVGRTRRHTMCLPLYTKNESILSSAYLEFHRSNAHGSCHYEAIRNNSRHFTQVALWCNRHKNDFIEPSLQHVIPHQSRERGSDCYVYAEPWRPLRFADKMRGSK
jgi:hypothetical protein